MAGDPPLAVWGATGTPAPVAELLRAQAPRAFPTRFPGRAVRVSAWHRGRPCGILGTDAVRWEPVV